PEGRSAARRPACGRACSHGKRFNRGSPPGGKSGNDRCLDRRQGSRLRTAGEHHPPPKPSQLWWTEIIPVVGPFTWRSALRKTHGRSEAAGRVKVTCGASTRLACWRSPFQTEGDEENRHVLLG